MSLIPDLFIYSATAYFITAIALIPQRRWFALSILLACSIVFFAIRLYLDRRDDDLELEVKPDEL